MSLLGSIVGGIFQGRAADKAADSVEKYQNRALDLAERQYDDARSDLAPARTLQNQQMSAFAGLLGMSDPNQPAQSTGAPQARSAFSPYGNGEDFRRGPNAFMSGPNTEYGAAPMATNGQPVQELPSQSGPLSGFDGSAFSQIWRNDYNRERDNIDSALANQGLVFSSARMNADSEAMARNRSGAFSQYLSTLMGTPPQSATNQTIALGQNFANQAGNAFTNIGNANANRAVGIGSAYTSGIQNIQDGAYAAFGNAAGGGLGMFGGAATPASSGVTSTGAPLNSQHMPGGIW